MAKRSMLWMLTSLLFLSGCDQPTVQPTRVVTVALDAPEVWQGPVILYSTRLPQEEQALLVQDGRYYLSVDSLMRWLPSFLHEEDGRWYLRRLAQPTITFLMAGEKRYLSMDELEGWLRLNPYHLAQGTALLHFQLPGEYKWQGKTYQLTNNTRPLPTTPPDDITEIGFGVWLLDGSLWMEHDVGLAFQYERPKVGPCF